MNFLIIPICHVNRKVTKKLDPAPTRLTKEKNKTKKEKAMKQFHKNTLIITFEKASSHSHANAKVTKLINTGAASIPCTKKKKRGKKGGKTRKRKRLFAESR